MYRHLLSVLISGVFLTGTTPSIGGQALAQEMTPGIIRVYSLPGFFLLRKVSLPSQSFSAGSVTRVKTSGSSQAKGWRGIKPLKSTRKGVEAVIGQPTTVGGSTYQTASEKVYVYYSEGRCEKGWPYGWNVTPDIVVMVSLYPNSTLWVTDLMLDESKYERLKAYGHDADRFHYVNQTDGIDIEVDESTRTVISGGNVISVSYVPTAAEMHLQCPDASRRLPPGRRQADRFYMLDAYGDVPFSHERERLDFYAGEMQRRSDAQVYVIAYAGKSAYIGEAKARAECARRYLITKHHIKAKRISAIDGGYREAREVELYLEPRAGPLPLAVPTIRPSKVKIIGSKKSMRCGDF